MRTIGCLCGGCLPREPGRIVDVVERCREELQPPPHEWPHWLSFFLHRCWCSGVTGERLLLLGCWLAVWKMTCRDLWHSYR